MHKLYIKAALGSAALFVALPAPALAAVAVVTVVGSGDIQLAGQPNGTTFGGDSTPANSPSLALTDFTVGTAITFSGIGGFRNTAGTPFGLDGGGGFFNQLDAFGIAGLRNGQLNGLVGLFLDAAVPAGTAPAYRDLTIDGVNFTSLSPLLRQVFWIGDGLTGTGAGAVQQFFAPTGATRLYLASYDGSGGYFDNVGTAQITINYTSTAVSGAVPEPATWAMMLAGFGAIGVAMRRRPNTRVSFA